MSAAFALARLLSDHGPDDVLAFDETGVVTAGQFARMVDTTQALLRATLEGESGANGKGAQVILACRDRLAFAVGLLAIWRTGCVAALPPNVAPESLRALRHGPDVATVLHDGLAEKGVDVRAACATEGNVAMASQPLAFESLRTDAGALSDLPERCLAVVYTSGTTGVPQACRKRSRQLLGEVHVLAESFPEANGARVVATVPAHHIYGVLFSVLWPLSRGGAFYRKTPLHPEPLSQAVHVARTVGATTDDAATDEGGRSKVALVSVPVHYRGLASLPAGVLTVPDLAFSSGAPLEQPTAEAMFDGHGLAVTEVLGSSETGGIASRLRGARAGAQGASVSLEAPPSDSPIAEPHGTEGRAAFMPLRGVQVDTDASGRLMVRSVMLEEPAAFFVTEDRIRLEHGGGFVHLGRADGVLKIGGARVSLAEVQSRLLEVEGVADAAVVAHEVGGIRGYELWAAVVLREGAASSVPELKRALGAWLPGVALPRRFRLVQSLPRTAAGKVRRMDVMALFDRPVSDAPSRSGMNPERRDELGSAEQDRVRPPTEGGAP